MYTIVEEAKKAKPAVNPREFIILVVLPEGSSPIYRQVKEWGDLRLGVVSQCMVRKRNTRSLDLQCAFSYDRRTCSLHRN